MDTTLLVLALALLVGFYMAWSIGASDVANAMGTSVGSHALTIKQAIAIAAIFEFLGAFLVGGHVTNTIKQGIVDPLSFVSDPLLFAWGMTAALFSTGIWLQFASAKGLPVSTTNSLVGAIIGFGLVSRGVDSVKWQMLGRISLSWIISPVLGGMIALITFFAIRKYILDSKDPLAITQKWAPWILCSVVLVLVSLFIPTKLLWMPLLASPLVAFAFSRAIRRVTHKAIDRNDTLARVEKVFAWIQVITACFMAFAHGSNDVSNAIGPVAAVIAIAFSHHIVITSQVPWWLLGMGGIGIVLGLATYGRKVIETIGHSITEITPTRGFAAEFGAAFTILVGSHFGLPLSTTQVLVGAVIGVGLARGISGLNLIVIRRILNSWIITMPATCAISMVLNGLIGLFI
ncbi:MAG: inorganic phosphate transporter [Myxococcaceae bacterium]|nr:inorganic phosphate transporter [Myxococcaceae bacterium]MBH2006189.1 inorganic phosphate transporter [Myxococcaceae bacterium]